jgi:hypothetical protein
MQDKCKGRIKGKKLYGKGMDQFFNLYSFVDRLSFFPRALGGSFRDSLFA